MTADLYDYPDLYDALFPIGAHLPFYLEIARQQAGPILELACGTGQLTIPLALLGLPTVGLDQSSAMLDVAMARASAHDAAIELLRGDMRDFSLGREFASIVIARNSLLHLLTTEDLLAAFRAVRRHLAPYGVFAFDIFNPDVSVLARSGRAPVTEMMTTQFGLLSVEETHEYDPSTQVNHALWYVSTGDRRDAWTMPLVLRSIFPQELPLLLSAAGLELVDRFGDLSSSPFGSRSRMQVCLCRRHPA